MADPQAPNIPADAPQDVKDFFECKADKLVWKKGKVTWLTIKVSDDVEVTPEVSFEHGKAAGSVQISASLAGLSGTVGASVNADGQLVIGDVSLVLKPFKSKIDEAVKTINDWFKHNHKKLKPAVLKKGEVTLEKTATTGAYAPLPVVPFGDEDQNQPQNVGLTPGWGTDADIAAWDGAVAQTTVGLAASSKQSDEPSSRPNPFTLMLALGLAALALLGLGIGFVFFGGSPGSTVSPTFIAAASQTPAQTASPGLSFTPTPTPTTAVTSSPSVAPPSEAASGKISGLCVRVVHREVEQFISYIEWFMWWTGVTVDHFDLYVADTNDDQPVRLEVDPASGAWYAPLGLHRAGDKQIVSIVAHLVDGTEIDVTDDLIDYFGSDTITVRYPEEDDFGDRCAEVPSR